MLAILRYLLWTSCTLLGLTIVSLNAKPVVFDYYLNTITLPLSFIIIIHFACGLLLGLGLNLIYQWKAKSLNNHLRAQNMQAENEIKKLQELLASTVEKQRTSPTEEAIIYHD